MKHYQAKHLLSKGYSGNVYLGENTKTKESVAIKVISLYQKEEIKALRKIVSLKKSNFQLETLKEKKNQHIVDHIDFYEAVSLPNLSPQVGSSYNWESQESKQTEGVLFHIVMELCTNGNLHSFLKTSDFQDEERVKYTNLWVKQICKGLLFLHHNGIVHKKLKLSDIVLTSDNYVKISGLGVALEKHNEDSPYGETAHISPEVVKQSQNVGPAADIWSLGVVIFQLLNWSVEVTTHLFYSSEKIEDSLKGKDETLTKIALMCLQLDPSQRPTPQEILNLLN